MLEMIIATFVFLIASLGLAGVWMQHSKAMGLASSRLIAQHLGQEQMEECLAAKFENVDGYAGARPPVVMNEVIRDKPHTATFSLVVTVAPEDPVEHWKVVTVTVSWRDQLGNSQLQYKSLLAKPVP